MFKPVALAASAVALMAATPAFAQDSDVFNGFYIGAIAGWDHPDLGGGADDDGVAFGLQAGYDITTSGAVAGLEVEAADSTVSEAGVSAKLDLYAGIRLGGEVAPGTLLYVKGGYTMAKVDFCDPGSCGDTLDGVRVGAGLEHVFNGNLYIKGEYRFSNYQFGVTRHQVVAGFGFRF